MDWQRQIDSYCERLGPGYWAEPVNALTNVAFVLAALVIAGRLRGMDAPLARALTICLGAIGVGSYLWHTHATAWAGLLDVLAIAVFILVYIFAVHRDVWSLSFWPALALTGAFFPYAALTAPLFAMLPVIGVSAGYMPVALLIVLHAVALRRRAPELARGLAIGAAILMLSITFRSLDTPVCAQLPLGTHFLWHCLNAVMLCWMIEVYRRHLVATRAA